MRNSTKHFASRPVFFSGWSACFSSKLFPVFILHCLFLLISQLTFPGGSFAQVTLDEALRIASGIPMAKYGSIEVRPEMNFG